MVVCTLTIAAKRSACEANNMRKSACRPASYCHIDAAVCPDSTEIPERCVRTASRNNASTLPHNQF